MEVAYTSDAQRDVASLNKKTASRILDKIDWFASQENPLDFAERLNDPRKLYRFRIGAYRAIFTLKKGQLTVLLVLAVKDRKDIYR